MVEYKKCTGECGLEKELNEDNFYLQCWDLTNLRPLSAKQNLIDGNRR